MDSVKIMIVDDDQSMTKYLKSYLTKREYEVSCAHSGQEALDLVKRFEPTIILLDVAMPGMNGLETLERIKKIRSDNTVIMLSGYGQANTIVRAMKLGAFDFITKPFDPPELEITIGKALENARILSELSQLREQVKLGTEATLLFSGNAGMLEVRELIDLVADTDATVLIRGESGTGKELVARRLHLLSSRNKRPLVKLNCAAIPYELLESELFGYERGAFTGAQRQKLGKFELANLGTIFLDEISEMHPALQAKLLQVLQDGEFTRLGGKEDISINVRVIAATNRNLEQAVDQGAFREDLFYRLNVVTILLPPLRERKEDIPMLIDYFLKRYNQHYGKNTRPFSSETMVKLMNSNWPGNVRQLENLVKRYVIIGNEIQIMKEALTVVPEITPSIVTVATPHTPTEVPICVNETKDVKDISLKDLGRRAALLAEQEAIERVLNQTRWNRREAAKILKISYKALLNKIKFFEEEKTRLTQESNELN
ncbi:MAG: sigma-54 dependent transcriptional regulator [Acidobacteriota bacterium]